MADKEQEKKIIVNVIYEDFEMTVNADDEARYHAAARHITERFNSYHKLYPKNSEHSILLMTLMDLACNLFNYKEPI